MVEEFRKNCKIGDMVRDAGLATPEDVERFDDLSYGDAGKWNLLDVYRPKKESGKLPVIVSVHGGGWVYGDKEVYQFYCMSLAQRGFAVVNFNYRLAPEYKFPAQLEDVNRAVEWVLGHGEEYGFDLEHIFMVGDSAGAHLAGLYCCICTDAEYASAYPFQVPGGFVPKAVALNCGVYVPIPRGDVKPLEREDVMELPKLIMPEGGTGEEAALIDLTEHITPAFPPVFFMTATEDFCRPQAAYLERALMKQGVSYTFKLYEGREKPLEHVFHVDMRNEAGRMCNDDECNFFKAYLNRKPIVEICAGSYEDCLAAAAGGADRVELNSALSVGGLTPTIATLRRVKKDTDLKVICIVRPRAAGFCYTEKEKMLMFEEAALLLEQGADGLAFGFLEEDGSVEEESTGRMIELIHQAKKEAVFHRAFDVAKDADEAMKTLIALGCDRVLTSGRQAKAAEGKELLKKLQESYGSKIQILAGSGVNAENAAALMVYTGIRQVHSSCKGYRNDATTAGGDVSYAYLPTPYELCYDAVDEEAVKKLVEAVGSLNA